MKPVLLIAVAVAIGLVIGAPALAQAPGCEEVLAVDEALDRADSVFVARIISVSDAGSKAKAQVEAVWKGPDLEQTVNLDGGDSADKVSGRTRVHVVGQRFLVVASWSPRLFNDDLCTATQLYVGAADTIPAQYQAALGAEQARLPLSSEPFEVSGSSGPSLRAVALVSLGLILIVTIAFLWRRATAFRPVLTESDFPPKQPEARENLPKPTRRRLAGWTSGRFSRSGRKQVTKLKVRNKR